MGNAFLLLSLCTTPTDYFGHTMAGQDHKGIVRQDVEFLEIMSSAPKPQTAPRRSTRIRAQIPVLVASLDSAVPFSERAHTLVVNTEGCGVRLSRSLDAGTPVLLDELPGGNKARGTVASSVPLGTEGKYWLVGIAFEERGNFWCIQPAPADWGDCPPVVAAVPLPKKKDEWPYALFSTKGEAHPGRK